MTFSAPFGPWYFPSRLPFVSSSSDQILAFDRSLGGPHLVQHALEMAYGIHAEKCGRLEGPCTDVDCRLGTVVVGLPLAHRVVAAVEKIDTASAQACGMIVVAWVGMTVACYVVLLERPNSHVALLTEEVRIQELLYRRHHQRTLVEC